jgi:hypothetical protein
MFSMARMAPPRPELREEDVDRRDDQVGHVRERDHATNASEITAWEEPHPDVVARSAPCQADRHERLAESYPDRRPRLPTTAHDRRAGTPSITKPVRVDDEQQREYVAKRAVGSTRAGRTTKRRQTAMPRPITKKSPKRSSTVS